MTLWLLYTVWRNFENIQKESIIHEFSFLQIIIVFAQLNHKIIHPVVILIKMMAIFIFGRNYYWIYHCMLEIFCHFIFRKLKKLSATVRTHFKTQFLREIQIQKFNVEIRTAMDGSWWVITFSLTAVLTSRTRSSIERTGPNVLTASTWITNIKIAVFKNITRLNKFFFFYLEIDNSKENFLLMSNLLVNLTSYKRL